MLFGGAASGCSRRSCKTVSLSQVTESKSGEWDLWMPYVSLAEFQNVTICACADKLGLTNPLLELMPELVASVNHFLCPDTFCRWC